MTEPSVWENPTWKPGEPGAFAVVIGVSRYDHLPGGGKETAAETYGMGQLPVSALTAHRFFEWLRDRYASGGVRLARCWLLLSPTELEVSRQPALAGSAPATLWACRAALREWFATMRDLPEAQARSSRALFFFSGHGLETESGNPVLLPCDVLHPPAGLLDDSISLRNLRDGLKGLAVPTQLFFVDACRNDHRRLREARISVGGTKILLEQGPDAANPELDSAALLATTTGTQAYQPRDVGDGALSLYGQALLEGVSEPPEAIRQTEDGSCGIGYLPLLGFVGRRVAELLADHGSTARQPVRNEASLTNDPLLVADVAADAPARAMPPDVQVTRRRLLPTVTDLPPTDWGRLTGDVDGPDIFGGPTMTRLWDGHRLVTGSGEPVRHNLVSVRRLGTRDYQLLVRVPDAPLPLTLEFSDHAPPYSCRVPPLGREAVLQLDLTADGTDSWDVTVAVAPTSRGRIGHAAALWQAYQGGGIAEVLDAAEELVLPVLRGEVGSPFPALVWALAHVRTRTGATDPWLDTLVAWHPGWPDFAILHDELGHRAGRFRDPGSATPRPVPYTSEALEYLAAGTPDATRDVPTRTMLERWRPGGLFCVFGDGPGMSDA